MRFETSQSMKLGQHMKLAPRMIQSMEILQMPLAELQERIEQELESNITLELEGPVRESPEASDTHAEIAPGDHADEFARLDAYERDNPDAATNEFDAPGMREQRQYDEPRTRSSRLDGEPDAKAAAMASAPARSAPLTDQLHDQWRLADLDARTRELGDYLIDKLEDDGYLRTDLTKLAADAPARLGAPKATELERTLLALQVVLEPPGVAARDARECLLLQLDALADFEGEPDGIDPADAPIIEAARTLVDDHLDDLMNNRLPRIAERTGFDLDRIKAGLTMLRRLSLAPARRLVSEQVTPIIPDAIVEYDEDQGRYIVYLNERSLPALHINREYALLSKDRAVEKKDRDFIKTNLANAQWLIDAVGQRRRTLLRVIEVVLEEQKDFFDLGPQALRPLPMTQVAEKLGIHVATVSRAVSEKYLMTPRGVVPLRRFFSGGMQTDDGEEVSYDAIKAALTEVIDGEDTSRPLSDDKLVSALKERGIEIARRTVAKYRAQLGIPTARLRKTY